MRQTSNMRMLLLPGLDGSGTLYDEFRRAMPGVQLEPLAYPADEILGYDELAMYVLPRLPKHEPWLLLAESFSGPLGLRLAAQRPAGLLGLILVATFHRKPMALPAWMVPTLAFRVAPPRCVIRRLMFEPGADEVSIDAFYDALRSVAAPTLAARARAALAADESAHLRTIDIPTLYLRAEHDKLFGPSIHTSLAEELPAMQVQVISGAPHLLLQRRPREAAQVISHWVSSLRLTPAT